MLFVICKLLHSLLIFLEIIWLCELYGVHSIGIIFVLYGIHELKSNQLSLVYQIWLIGTLVDLKSEILDFSAIFGLKVILFGCTNVVT